MPQEITQDEFQDKIEKGVVMVDFWAPWCGPCKMLGPIIEEVSKEVEGKASVFKMNVDDNPDVPMKFGIRSIPTVMVFKDGEAVEQMVGLRDKASYLHSINQHVEE